ncbi:type VI protein secretion system component VasA [Janthinobacterium sp. CG_23.3]|uniref:type VI secretion system baseplate subunit TssF n=1 Tax=Janthinobacterium sp. CG_23.3 TaxID=3349634 RepID=UPI0038D386DF
MLNAPDGEGTMEQLLPYAERALDQLRGACREFLVRANTSAETGMRSAATAPPAWLLQGGGRPLRACAIAHIDGNGDAARQCGDATTVARGSVLTPLSGSFAASGWRTAYDVTLAPVLLSQARFARLAPAAAPGLPSGVSACISLVIESCAEAPALDRLGLPALRVYLDGEPEFCAALRDALFAHTVCAYVEISGSGHWSLLDRIPLGPVGFAAADALLPAASGRLLAEYLAFPEKFNFVDIDVAALRKYLPPGGRVLTLHLGLTRVPADSDMARRLARLSSKNLLLGCTPVFALAAPAGVCQLQCSTERGAPAFAQMLTLYDMARPTLRQWVISAIARLVHRPAEAWLRGRDGVALVRGVGVRMTLDAPGFAGHGMHAFAEAMAAFLGEHVDPAGFIELRLVCERSGEEVLRCAPCNSGANLVRANADRLNWHAVTAPRKKPTLAGLSL